MSGAGDPHPRDWVRQALACADLGVFKLDVDAGRFALDTRAGEMLGFDGGDVTFDAFLAVVDPDDRQRVADHLESAIAAEGDAYHVEFRTASRRWIAADGRTCREHETHRRLLVGLVEDITLRRTTEDARSRLVDEMARSLRFHDMVVGVVASDLRSPLAAVATAGEALAHHTQDAVVQDATTKIAASTERMTRIVDQLLELTHARLDGQIPLRSSETDLVAIARQVAAETEAAAPAAAITVEPRADASCTCDPARIAQVLSNLIGNAVRHGADPRRVRVIVDGTGSRVVSVTVRSPGEVPRELIPTLFNPFRHLRPDHGARDRRHGLGLGLYVARRIAIGHGGDITVTTSEQDGTAFRLELPRVATSASFSLTPDRVDEENVLLQRIGQTDRHSQVTASLFGILPVQERAPDAFASLVERHVRLLALALDRQIYRDARANLATDLRTLAEQLGAMGASASDVAELHSQALQRAIKGAPAVKVQALVAEGRLLALELMGRLVTFYRKRSGFGSLSRSSGETPS